MSVNPNHSYFDGFYQEIWQQIIPEALTEKEIDHLIDHYKLDGSTRVLDLMCGHGRHSLALARKGISVTAVDNLAAYIHQIERERIRESLPIRAVQANLMDWSPQPGHHWALCMGNSLNFFSPQELPIVLQKVSDSLVDGGYFWINSWSIAEIIEQQPIDGTVHSTPVGRFQHTNRFQLMQDPPRLEIESRIEDETGKTEEKWAIDYLYSLDELRSLLACAGLQFLKAESVPGKKPFEVGAPRVYILSQKLKI